MFKKSKYDCHFGWASSKGRVPSMVHAPRVPKLREDAQSARLAVRAVGLSAEPKVGKAELRGRECQGLEELQASFIPPASAAALPADATRARRSSRSAGHSAADAAGASCAHARRCKAPADHNLVHRRWRGPRSQSMAGSLAGAIVLLSPHHPAVSTHKSDPFVV